MAGVGVCDKLRVINVSHNLLRQFEGLEQLRHLLEIHAEANQIETLANIPCLNHLTHLNVNDNKVEYVSVSHYKIYSMSLSSKQPVQF